MTATSKRASGALIHPALDFLMLGGLSLLIPLLHFYPLFNDPLVSNKLGWAAFYLAFVVNNPHFMHSYQLFYRGFPHKMHAMSRASQIRYLLAGVIVPFALLNGILAGGMVGATMFLGYLVNLMFFLVGWHYAKQGFGILVVMAGRKGLFFQAIERKILLVNAYTIWALTWVKTNIVAQDHNYYGIPYATFDLPDILGPVTMAAGGLTTAATLYVFFRLWMREKTLPVSGVIGYLAPIYLWLGFWNLNSAAFVFIPALH
ncbi:MAG: hypothetical protein KDJ15_08220, partial [Alphaproteobacteria bacterium]|nr:hypothetical protein [Alphaproteobacteria bacterium]